MPTIAAQNNDEIDSKTRRYIPFIEVDLFNLKEKRESSDETEEKRMARGVILGDVTPDLTYLRSHT